MKKRSIRWIAVAAIFGGVVASSPNSPVKADTFYPLPQKPTVTVVYSDSFQPGSIVAIETVTATIALNATVADLATVVLCVYKPTGAGSLSGFSTSGDIDTVRHSCDGTDANRIKITWTEGSGGAFVIDEDSGTLGTDLDESTVTTGGFTGEGGAYDEDVSYTGTSQALQIAFKFKAGGAMLTGSDWVVSVAAAYPDTVCNKGAAPVDKDCTQYSGTGFLADDLIGSGAVTGKVADYYQTVVTGGTRKIDGEGTVGLNYSFLKSDTQSAEVTSTEGEITYITNDYASLTLRGTDFKRVSEGSLVDEDFLTLQSETGTVGDGKVAIDCRDFSRLDDELTEDVNEGSVLYRVVRVATEGAGTAAGGTDLLHKRNATDSTPASARIVCKLTYGGVATTALAQYANTVTVGLKQWTDAE